MKQKRRKSGVLRKAMLDAICGRPDGDWGFTVEQMCHLASKRQIGAAKRWGHVVRLRRGNDWEEYMPNGVCIG